MNRFACFMCVLMILGTPSHAAPPVGNKYLKNLERFRLTPKNTISFPEKELLTTPSLHYVSSQNRNRDTFLAVTVNHKRPCKPGDTTLFGMKEMSSHRTYIFYVVCRKRKPLSKNYGFYALYASKDLLVPLLASFGRASSLNISLKIRSSFFFFLAFQFEAFLGLNRTPSPFFVKQKNMFVGSHFYLYAKALLKTSLKRCPIGKKTYNLASSLQQAQKSMSEFLMTRLSGGRAQIGVRKNSMFPLVLSSDFKNLLTSHYHYLEALKCNKGYSNQKAANHYTLAMAPYTLKKYREIKKGLKSAAQKARESRSRSESSYPPPPAPPKPEKKVSLKKWIGDLLSRTPFVVYFLFFCGIAITINHFLQQLALRKRLEEQAESERLDEINYCLELCGDDDGLDEFYTEEERQEINGIVMKLYRSSIHSIKKSQKRISRLSQSAAARKDEQARAEAQQTGRAEEESRLVTPEKSDKDLKQQKELDEHRLLSLIEKICNEALPIPLPHPPSTLLELLPILKTKIDEIPEDLKQLKKIKQEYKQLEDHAASLSARRAVSKLQHLWSGIVNALP